MTENQPEKSDRVGLIIGLLIILIGIVGSIGSLLEIRLGRESAYWPQTEGTILSTSIGRTVSTEESGGTHWSRTTFHLDVRYGYSVDGTPLIGSLWGFGHDVASEDENEIEEIQRQYPPGKSVDVFYDPQDPRRAVIVRGVSEYLYGILVISSLALGAGVTLLMYAVPRLRRLIKLKPLPMGGVVAGLAMALNGLLAWWS